MPLCNRTAPLDLIMQALAILSKLGIREVLPPELELVQYNLVTDIATDRVDLRCQRVELEPPSIPGVVRAAELVVVRVVGGIIAIASVNKLLLEDADAVRVVSDGLTRFDLVVEVQAQVVLRVRVIVDRAVRLRAELFDCVHGPVCMVDPHIARNPVALLFLRVRITGWGKCVNPTIGAGFGESNVGDGFLENFADALMPFSAGMENAHCVGQEARRLGIVTACIVQCIDIVGVGMEPCVAAFLGHFEKGHVLNQAGNFGVFLGVPVKKPGFGVVWRGLVAVAETVSIVRGVYIDIVHMLVLGEGVSGVFEELVQGKSEVVHFVASLFGEILCFNGVPARFECDVVALLSVLVEELCIAC